MKNKKYINKEFYIKSLLNNPAFSYIVEQGLDISEIENMATKLMINKISKVHKNAITEVRVKNNGKEVTMYQTKVSKDFRPRCRTLDSLYEKLYDYYFGNEEAKETDFSFEKIYNIALDERTKTRAITEKTIRHYKSSFNSMISEDFRKKDIRTMKKADIEEYIQIVIRDKELTEKRLKTLKGLFNLVFEYATDPDHKIVNDNPVPKHNQIFKAKKVTKKPVDKAFQPNDIQKMKEYFWHRVKTLPYDVNGFAVLFACETGVREGEIPSLKWDDIDFDNMFIHIHSQQNDHQIDGQKVYYYNPTTKNEKGVSMDGRRFPITDELLKVLLALRTKQTEHYIKSDWVFAKMDGNWTTTVAYEKCLRVGCRNLELNLTNNHAIRMYLNSYVFIPKGIEVADRAALLGHSVEVNLKYYTFAEDNMDKFRKILNGKDNTQGNTQGKSVI